MVETLGHIAVQPDWTVDVDGALGGGDSNEGPHRFWVSAYKQGSESIHDSVEATATATAVDAGGKRIVSLATASGDSEGVAAEYVSPRQLRLWSRRLAIPAALHTAAGTAVECSNTARAATAGVRSIDVSRHGGLLVAGGDDGALDVYETTSGGGAHRVRLAGHLGDVTCCRFFPSGQVVLSGATDMRLKVWSAADGSNPVTLVGHTARVTDCAIVGVGKNVVSAGADGSVRLWHCGSAMLVHMFTLSDSAVNRIVVAEAREGLRQGSESSSAGEAGNEFETVGKIVVAACEDGRVLVLDLHSRETVAVFGAVGDPPVRAVAYDTERDTVFAGRADGSVAVWSGAKTATTAPVLVFTRGTAAVSDVCLVRTSAAPPLLCVGTEDGQLFLAAVSVGAASASVEVVEDLVAFDVDPITQIRPVPSSEPNASRQNVWAAARCSRVCRF
ncbi:hypothetical protein LPJ72_002120 [Coemansia sp. Benny D160-2]|nr:hypothetical protein LPJ72_002120 [Coemansia sp. Benny D160-2]